MRRFEGRPVSRFLRLIRFSHTIFALPFALGALIVAANGWPSVPILLLVIVCMVFARTAAMLFNRLVDWSLDQRNPRTASRHLLISKLSVLILLILITFVALIGFGVLAKLGTIYYCSLPLIAAALVYEHKTEKRDIAGINRAFFRSNAFVSAVFLVAICVDRLH